MADERLRAHLAGLGATDAQMAGLGDGDLIGLASDLQVAAGLDLSLEELCRAARLEPEEVRSIYRRLGLRADELAGFGEGDIAAVAFVAEDSTGIVDEVGTPLMRVTGTVLARLAEAAIAAYVQDVELGPEDADLVARIDQNWSATGLALTLGDSLPIFFRHHLWAAVRRQRATQQDVAAPQFVRVAVGFVDLVGFTSRSGEVEPAQLIADIEDFERRAFDVATRHGGWIVKSIGDEVMIAGGDAAVVAEIAIDLIETSGDDPSVAPRGGVSAGDVLFRLGDYYGPVVNVAARLATEAVPGEVLTDLAAIEAAGVNVRPAGRRLLKGFAEPVSVSTVERVTTTSRVGGDG